MAKEYLVNLTSRVKPDLKKIAKDKAVKAGYKTTVSSIVNEILEREWAAELAELRQQPMQQNSSN